MRFVLVIILKQLIYTLKYTNLYAHSHTQQSHGSHILKTKIPKVGVQGSVGPWWGAGHHDALLGGLGGIAPLPDAEEKLTF